MNRRRWSALGGLWLVLLAVACSGDDSGDPEAADGDSSTTVASTTPTAQEGIVALCPGEEFVDGPRSIVLSRDLPDGEPEAVAAAALESVVVAGITSDEQSAGYLVPWPDGADVLRAVTLDGDTLTVDFDRSVVDAYVAATGSSTRFFVPLVETAFLVPEVEHLEFVIDGSAREWNEWWQGEASRFDRASWRDRRPEPEAACPA